MNKMKKQPGLAERRPSWAPRADRGEAGPLLQLRPVPVRLVLGASSHSALELKR